MQILTTIIPVFTVIALGWICRRLGFLPASFLDPANRLVFYIAIPAMIFRAVSRGSLKTDFQPLLLLTTCAAILLLYAAAWLTARCRVLEKSARGSFIQACFHGNLGYIGLAVCWYYLGDAGFAAAGILTGFIMILQNVLAVAALQFHSPDVAAPDTRISRRSTSLTALIRVLENPVVISALAGILFSLSGLPLPVMAERVLGIVGGMALPLALLLIGGSLSFRLIRDRWELTLATGLFKLVLLPLLGLGLFRLAGLSASGCLPAMILLASPTATISYVMAVEMKGDPSLAVGAVSGSTLASAASISVWLGLLQSA